MKGIVLVIFGIFVMLCGCVNPPKASTTAPSTTLLECTLSLCDCKCHVSGTAPEEKTGQLCGINCFGEYGVEGCELKDGSCVEVKIDKETTTTAPAQMANPASQKCVSDGGRLEIVDRSDGQIGVCHFDDGTICDEWAYFRGECKPGDCICAAVGSRSEGWYCNGKLLYWSQCSGDPEALRDCSRYAGAGACTMEYAPVCGKVRANGVFKEETFGNACTACTRNTPGEAVVGYRQGECQ
ncbi:MAG: DUF333 domain-containing protein [Candidatus Altiarchaeota archaeon]|nr:DUF333 domain-containing protein [Candidatus Altiarchaeota archaeon]